MINSSRNQRDKTLEDLRLEAKLQKSDVYRGVGVTARTYDRWVEGKTLPDLSKAAQLARILKAPLVDIFSAFGVDIDDLVGSNDNSFVHEANSKSHHNMSELVSLLRELPEDQANIVLYWLIGNKKDEGPHPSSGQPS